MAGALETIKLEYERNFNRRHSKLVPYKSIDYNRSNNRKTRKERKCQGFSTPSNSDSDE